LLLNGHHIHVYQANRVGNYFWATVTIQQFVMKFCLPVSPFLMSYTSLNMIHVHNYFSPQCEQMFMNTSWLLAFMNQKLKHPSLFQTLTNICHSCGAANW
jgi:hypothetical protein